MKAFVVLCMLHFIWIGSALAQEKAPPAAEVSVPLVQEAEKQDMVDATMENPDEEISDPLQLKNYSGLAELVAAICDDAGKVFNNFFSATVVTVQPFTFITSTGEKRLTPLGESMADQMIAMINNGRIDFAAPRMYDQRLAGVLQEVGGYLRVHISGFNGQALRRSYTANVEMSEALYRALYVSSF